MSLDEDLHFGEASADELITAIAGSFGMSRWESGRVVEYFDASGIWLSA